MNISAVAKAIKEIVGCATAHHTLAETVRISAPYRSKLLSGRSILDTVAIGKCVGNYIAVPPLRIL